MFTACIRCTVLVAVLSPFAASSPAQDIASAPVTLWRFMGIPQGVQRMRDAVTNRRGNHPGLERKDAMKRLADPANLASDNPAIKAAAEIKAAEDMKKQKIKAIKYLAEIGCGCYDKDGKITEALLAATDDCTPDVRLAAVEAIQDAAGGNCCKKCGSTSCCSEKIAMRLSEMAYERDDDGCPVEPSAEIRAAAKRALNACCPGRVDLSLITEELEDELPVPMPPVTPVPVPGETGDAPATVPGEIGEDDTAATEKSVLPTLTVDGNIPSAAEADQASLPKLPQASTTAEHDDDQQTRLVTLTLEDLTARSDDVERTGFVALTLEDLTVPTDDAKQNAVPPLEQIIVEPLTSQR